MLEDAGFNRRQVEALVAFVEHDRVTKSDFAGLRVEFEGLRGDFGALRGDFGDLRGEFGTLRGDFGALKAEFKADTGLLRAEFARTQGEVVLLRWMTGFGLALNLTILAKLFLN